MRFPDVGSVEIERQSWYKRDRKGNIVGSIYQFPLVFFTKSNFTLQRGVKMLQWGRGERVRFLVGNFDCAPIR